MPTYTESPTRRLRNQSPTPTRAATIGLCRLRLDYKVGSAGSEINVDLIAAAGTGIKCEARCI